MSGGFFVVDFVVECLFGKERVEVTLRSRKI
jgi:hypothetical protein